MQWQHARDNTRRCWRRPGRHVILLMMRRKFCFLLKVYGFLRCCHIGILSGLSIMPWTLLFYCDVNTHLWYFLFMYVICMYVWFYECFVRNDEIKLWNQWHSIHIRYPFQIRCLLECRQVNLLSNIKNQTTGLRGINFCLFQVTKIQYDYSPWWVVW